MSRDEMIFDDCYGSFFSSMPPLNFVQIPVLPIALVLRYKHPMLVKVNTMLMQVQYVLFMMIFFCLFVCVSAAIIPIAYLVCVSDKLSTMTQQTSNAELIKNNIMFIPFGLPILGFDLLADCY